MSSTLPKVSVDDARFGALIARHKAFWEASENDSFLHAADVNAASAPMRLPQPDGSTITHADPLRPDMVDPAALIDEIEHWEPARFDGTLRAQGQYMVAVGTGDLMPYCSPLPKIPLPEAILGCPIKMTEGQIWNQHYPGDPREVLARGTNFERNPWFQLYVEAMRQMQSRLGKRFPMVVTSYRGPSDLVAAVMGVQETCIGWIDQPALMARLMRLCTDLLLTLIEASRKMVRPIAGGYVSGHRIWAPELVIGTQSDHSTLLSPERYARQILPYDREVIKSCPLSDFHLHSAGLHVAPVLVELPELDAIQVSMDPTPAKERDPREIEMLHLIHAHKPLILSTDALTSVEQGERFLAQFPRSRLCFTEAYDPAIYETVPGDLPGKAHWLLEE